MSADAIRPERYDRPLFEREVLDEVAPRVPAPPREPVDPAVSAAARILAHAQAAARNAGRLVAPHTYVRHDAGDTPRKAAEGIRLRTGSARRRVLEAIVQAGAAGATDEELQRRLGLNPSTQRPRRLECVEAGYVVDSGERRATSSGSAAVVWLSTPLGREALEAAPRTRPAVADRGAPP